MEKYLQQKADDGEFSGDPEIISAGIVAMIMGIFTLGVYSPTIYGDITEKTVIRTFVEGIINLYCV